MTPRSIYYKEDHSCKYDIQLEEQISKDMSLGLIDVLGGTSPEGESEVIEHGHGISKAGHVQDMIYFKVDISGFDVTSYGYASTVHDMDAQHSEVKFFMMKDDEGDEMAVRLQEEGLQLKYPLH